jgi:hypothetical protein
VYLKFTKTIINHYHIFMALSLSHFYGITIITFLWHYHYHIFMALPLLHFHRIIIITFSSHYDYPIFITLSLSHFNDIISITFSLHYHFSYIKSFYTIIIELTFALSFYIITYHYHCIIIFTKSK